MTWQTRNVFDMRHNSPCATKKKTHTWEINQMLTSALSGTTVFAKAGVTMTKFRPESVCFFAMKFSSCSVKVFGVLIEFLKYSSFRQQY